MGLPAPKVRIPFFSLFQCFSIPPHRFDCLNVCITGDRVVSTVVVRCFSSEITSESSGCKLRIGEGVVSFVPRLFCNRGVSRLEFVLWFWLEFLFVF